MCACGGGGGCACVCTGVVDRVTRQEGASGRSLQMKIKTSVVGGLRGGPLFLRVVPHPSRAMKHAEATALSISVQALNSALVRAPPQPPHATRIPSPLVASHLYNYDHDMALGPPCTHLAPRIAFSRSSASLALRLSSASASFAFTALARSASAHTHVDCNNGHVGMGQVGACGCGTRLLGLPHLGRSASARTMHAQHDQTPMNG
jgi:hypothetical protein